MGNSSSWKRTRRPDDQTALMRMQLQIARCADLLARTDRIKPRRTLTDSVWLWMRAEVVVLEAHAG